MKGEAKPAQSELVQYLGAFGLRERQRAKSPPSRLTECHFGDDVDNVGRSASFRCWENYSREAFAHVVCRRNLNLLLFYNVFLFD